MNELVKRTSFPNWHWLVSCDYWEHFKCTETPINSGRMPAEEVEKFLSSF